jgi:phage tail-like protein
MADADASLGEFIAFRFRVGFYADEAGRQLVCRGAFSEVSGLEASMTSKALKEGGRNWGDVQLSGPTTFAPVVMKRGFTEVGDLWSWFDSTTRQANYGLRYTGLIEVFHPSRGFDQAPDYKWWLLQVLPAKFKGPDLSGTASQIAIEELHVVHQGLVLERRADGQGGTP